MHSIRRVFLQIGFTALSEAVLMPFLSMENIFPSFTLPYTTFQPLHGLGYSGIISWELTLFQQRPPLK